MWDPYGNTVQLARIYIARISGHSVWLVDLWVYSLGFHFIQEMFDQKLAQVVEEVMKTAAANVTNAKKIVAEAIKLIAEHKGDKPAAQGALFGGGSVMTARDKIPQDRLIALAPIIGNYIPATAPSTA